MVREQFEPDGFSRSPWTVWLREQREKLVGSQARSSRANSREQTQAEQGVPFDPGGDWPESA
eukprot:659002-Amphidinium_carterae.1